MFKRILLELQSNCNRECFFCNRIGDESGKRIVNGKNVIRTMPTHYALDILDQAAALGFTGHIAFHHMSEPFLDPRIIDMAWAAKERGMRPYEHTNGDVLRKNDALCKAAVEVFEYIVVGLYDYKNETELAAEKQYWQHRLKGTQVRFSLGNEVFPRTFIPFDDRMFREKKPYPQGACSRPFIRLIIHYDGNVALCCEDMVDSFDLGNAFETPIQEIWYSQKHSQIIRDLQQGRRERYPLCSHCPLPPTVTLPVTKRIVNKLNRVGKKLTLIK